MKAFPLIRVKWSNEHIMAAVLFVLLIYHLPIWIKDPGHIFGFLLMLATGLFLDAICNMLRYKRLWCSVSAAITASMISLLTYGFPILWSLSAVGIALLLGKHLWGGTGKNIFNPAMLGILVISLVYRGVDLDFGTSIWLLPALMLSIPFLKMRPFAGAGYITGAILAFVINRELTFQTLLMNGVIFFGCLVLTDPVTVTFHPLIGLLGGFLTGFFVYLIRPSIVDTAVGVLAFNVLSYLFYSLISRSGYLKSTGFSIKKAVTCSEEDAFVDLTNQPFDQEEDISYLKEEDIINRIKNNEVYGMGGAAFPSWKKILAAKNSKAESKVFIINGVECDPGLIHDHWLLRNKKDEMCKGAMMIGKLLGISTVQIAVKNTEGLSLPKEFQIHKIKDYYPAGAEHSIVTMVLKKAIKPEDIPALSGILVLNVQTVIAIYEAVYKNKKADTRYITVANLKKNSAKVARVKLGDKIRDIMEAVYSGTIYMFAGGGIMQAYHTAEEAIIDKTVNFIAASNLPEFKESPQCSNCGRCSRVCPRSLMVKKIADLVDQGKAKAADKYHVRECISCGGCSYVCLAGRNTAVRVKEAKEAL